RRRHTRWPRDWSSDVCSSDLVADEQALAHERLRFARSRAAHYRPLPSVTAQVNSKVSPHLIDSSFGLGIHDDLVRPLACEPLFFPLARRVDPHLRAEREATARVVEHVDRA